ncbi:hypothetical protein [Streptomyces sp. NPDC048419]|uniref:hypothetical protein n=1 Tax=Streptomyces sp. NPDC048419 TaxID=3365547 RepID=UPI00371AEA82
MALSWMRFTAVYEAGDAWLATFSAHPTLVRTAWNSDMLAPITSGARWLVAEAALMTTLKAINRIREEYRGPVLADSEVDKAWWLVPIDAAKDLADVPQLTVQVPGRPLHVPPAGGHLETRMWLQRPDGSGLLTDPAVLAAAFGPDGYRHAAEAS